jgi:anti-anti-sigma regulatory factor
MLRITETREHDSLLRLRLDGTLTAESFADLEAAWREGSKQTTIVILDMAGVSFMNVPAARKIAAIKGDRLRIVNCSPFIAALLETVERSR